MPKKLSQASINPLLIENESPKKPEKEEEEVEEEPKKEEQEEEQKKTEEEKVIPSQIITKHEIPQEKDEDINTVKTLITKPIQEKFACNIIE